MGEHSIYNVDFGIGKRYEHMHQRPAIIFEEITELGMYIVIPLTSNMEQLNLPYTVQIGRTNLTSLRENSAALVFQIKSKDKIGMEGGGIAKAEEYQINKIKSEIKSMLSL